MKVFWFFQDLLDNDTIYKNFWIIFVPAKYGSLMKMFWFFQDLLDNDTMYENFWILNY